MNELEFARMVATLTGDGSGYQKMLDDAVAQTDKATKHIDKSLTEAEKSTKAWGTLTNTVVSGLATLGAKNYLSGALHNFEEAELIGLKLTATLEANGRSVEELKTTYEDFAKELQKTTTAEDDAILKSLQLAESYGITDEAAKRAVKNSIALAAAKGGEASSYIRVTAALEQGHTEMLGRMLPALRDIKDDSERAAKAQELLAKMFSTAEAEAKSHAGQMKILHRDYGNMLEDFGKIVAEGLHPFIEVAKSGVETVSEFSSTTKIAIVSVGALAVGVGALATAFAALGVVINSTKTAWAALKAIALTETLINMPYAVWQFTNALKNSTMAVGAFKVAVAAAAVYLTAELIFALAGGNAALRSFNDSLKESDDLKKKFLQQADKSQIKFFEDVKASDNPLQMMESEAERAKKNVEGLSQALANAKKEQESADTSKRFIPLAGAGYQATFEAAQKQVEDVTARYEKAKTYLEKINSEIKSLLNPTEDPKLLAQAKELTESLEFQLQTIGMTANEAAIYKLRMQGASDETLMAAEHFAALLDKAKETQQLTKSINDLEESLRGSVETFGMSSDEATLYKLRLQGATDEQLVMIESLMEQKRGLEETNEVMKRGEQVVKQFMTPTQKYADRVSELNDLLNAGAIDQDTYSRAVEDANKLLGESGESAKAAREEVQKLDAVLANSADAQERVVEYLETIHQGGDPKQMKKQMEQMNREFFAGQIGAGDMPDNRMVVQPKDNDVNRGAQKTRTDDLLMKINTTLSQIRDKPQIVFTTTDLEG